MVKTKLYHYYIRIRSKFLNHNNIPSLLLGKHLKKTGYLFHSSAFSFGNAGDFLLPIVLRDLLDFPNIKRKWKGNHVHHPINEKTINTINKSDGLVVGGGGLFLSDTNPNSLSGWQWNCSTEMLEKINKPLILFAVGYNRFRDQPEFSDTFKKNIVKTVEKSGFIGLRNHGSIENVKKYLPTDLQGKLEFQPCMTTVISKLYPKLTNYRNKENYIAVNCAFDRSQLRLGSRGESIRVSIAKVLKKLSENYEIRYYSHMENDLQITKELDQYGVKYKIVNLQFKSAKNLVKLYSKPKLVMGMRGHAQMIPFGCLTPILSIVSHNKLQWFIDDIKHPEWGVDVLSDSFETELFQKATELLGNTDKTINDIEVAQEKLWNVTQTNIKKIENIVK